MGLLRGRFQLRVPSSSSHYLSTCTYLFGSLALSKYLGRSQTSALQLSRPFFLLCLAKGVFSPVPPVRGYSVPPLSFDIVLFTSFCPLSSHPPHLDQQSDYLQHKIQFLLTHKVGTEDTLIRPEYRLFAIWVTTVKLNGILLNAF